MKQILYACLLVFSIFMSVGGIGIVSEGGDFLDYIMLIVFIGLVFFSVVKLYKAIQKSKKLKNTFTSKNSENQSNNKQVKKDEKVIVEGNDKYDDLKKQNEMLKMKLDLKENYIQDLEKNKLGNDNITDDNKIATDIYIDNESEKSLDLTYTKAKKLESSFIVLDFETTGLKYQENEIIQYGVVEYENGIVKQEISKYFKPNKPVGKTVMRKTGITNEFLNDKPKLSPEDLEELKNTLQGKTIVAHNAPFDMKFLLFNLHNFGVDYPKYRVFDTLTHARRLIKESPNHKLETLKTYFNLDDGLSHNALNDCRATGNLALMLIDRMNTN